MTPTTRAAAAETDAQGPAQSSGRPAGADVIECVPELVDGTYVGCGECEECRDQADAEDLAEEEYGDE